MRILKVTVESDTKIRLFGECTRDIKDDYLGRSRNWAWQGGRFGDRPPHWVWGCQRETPGGLDACMDLIGKLLRDRRIDKVEIDYITVNTPATPTKRDLDIVDPQTSGSKRQCM